jgi:hypothetical protein
MELISYQNQNVSVRITKRISSFRSNGEFMLSVEGKMPTAKEIKAGVPQDFVLFAPRTMYINDVPLNTNTRYLHVYHRSQSQL